VRSENLNLFGRNNIKKGKQPWKAKKEKANQLGGKTQEKRAEWRGCAHRQVTDIRPLKKAKERNSEMFAREKRINHKKGDRLLRSGKKTNWGIAR